MFVDQLSASPHHRLNQILHTLKHVHACELPVQDPHKLQEWAAQAQSERTQIVEHHTFNSYMQQPAYVKANLILEAVKMLTEVAPKRRKTVKEHEEPRMKTLNEGKQKPDFLDLDKDGNKKEPMKQAAQQAKKLEEKSGDKPDFLDLDKDGDRKEPMKQAAKQSKKEVDEAKQDPEGDALVKAHLAKYGAKEGPTRVAKGAKYHRPGSGHVGRTGSAQADAPMVRPSSVRKTPVLAEDQNLDKAQTLLAAKDISDRLQGMAEDAAKMAVDDLMPLVDTMKDQFGLEAATAFNNVVKQQLQTVLDSIIAAKDQTDNAINTMESGGMPAAPADISQPLPPMSGAAPAAPPAEAPAASAPEPGAEMGAEPGAEGEIDFEKEFAAAPATSGPEEEPLGRAKKEVAEALNKPQDHKDLLANAANAAMTGKDDKGRPVNKRDAQETLKALTNMKEAAKKPRSAYAVGMAKAMELKGDKPPLKKSTIKKAHEIARSIETDVKESRQRIQVLRQDLDEAVHAYRAHVGSLTESWIQQQGDLRSAVLQAKVISAREQLQEAIAEYKQNKQEWEQHVQMQQMVQTKLHKLEEQMIQTPYGVKGQLTTGAPFRKFFESAEMRDTWIQYNQAQIQQVQHVTLSEMQQVADRLRKLI